MPLIEQYNNELYHYGVKGMKWGIRKSRVDQAYNQASRKLRRLDNRVNRNMKRLDRVQKYRNSKLRRAATLLTAESGDQYRNVERNLYWSEKRTAYALKRSVKKADKWYKEMQETFKNTSVKLTKEQQDMGRQYSEMLIARKKKKR